MTSDGRQTRERSRHHKGAVEGDRPTDEQQGNPNGDGVDENGLPDDPVAIAEDVEGANEDESQGYKLADPPTATIGDLWRIRPQ